MKKIISKTFSVIIAIIIVIGITVPIYAYESVVEKDGVMQLGDFDSLVDGYIIYYPTDLENSDKKYPVAVWANGTMCAPVLYYNLLVGVAKQGYIVIASPELMSKDGSDQQACIDYIFNKNIDSNSVFYNKVDTDKVGAFGHSQGGLSSVNAAVSDDRIKAIVSIAGSSNDKQTKKLSIPSLFLAGTMDTIVLPALWVKPSYNGCPAPAVYASLKNGIHTSCIYDSDKYINYIVKWFNAWLNDDGDKSAFTSGGELSRDSAWTGFKYKNFETGLTASVFATQTNPKRTLIISVLITGASVAYIITKRKKMHQIKVSEN